jgi:hypothetical protein
MKVYILEDKKITHNLIMSSESSNRLSNVATSYPRPFINSSFRIDDILLKKESPIADENHNSNFSKIENATLAEKIADLANESKKNLILRKVTAEKDSHEEKQNIDMNHSSARIMSALSSYYDISCQYPGISMLMGNTKPSLSQDETNSFLKKLNSEAVAAASAESSANSSLGFFANLSSAFFTPSSSLLVASNKIQADFQNKLNTSGNVDSNKNEVKHSIKLCRRRKARTVFSDQQLSGLERRFESQKYLSTPERIELANSLGLSETQVSFSFVF